MNLFDRPAFIIQPPPISTNALFRNVEKVGRVKTTAYKAWCAASDEMLTVQHPLPRFTGPVDVSFFIGEVGVGRMDSDNTAKAYLDALVRARIIRDDSRKHVRSSRAVWVPGMRACVIEIRPASDLPQLAARITARVPAGLSSILR